MLVLWTLGGNEREDDEDGESCLLMKRVRFSLVLLDPIRSTLVKGDKR